VHDAIAWFHIIISCVLQLLHGFTSCFFYGLVHYNGYLEYADEPYDSTRLRNKQCQVKLGQSKFFHLHKHTRADTCGLTQAHTVRWIRHFTILLIW